MIEFGHFTHPGLNRDCNEDTYAADLDLGLWLIADGLGGAGAGDVASALTRDSITQAIRDGMALDAAIQQANQQLIEFSRQRRHSSPLGTTLVAACVQPHQVQIIRVGDCRACLWQNHTLTQLLPGDSGLKTLLAQNILTSTPEHLPVNTLTQALGVTPPAQLCLHTLSGPWYPGHQLLLCSDGLSEHVNTVSIASILAQSHCSAQECVDWLIASALDGGGTDNITAILIRQH